MSSAFFTVIVNGDEYVVPDRLKNDEEGLIAYLDARIKKEKHKQNVQTTKNSDVSDNKTIDTHSEFQIPKEVFPENVPDSKTVETKPDISTETVKVPIEKRLERHSSIIKSLDEKKIKRESPDKHDYPDYVKHDFSRYEPPAWYGLECKFGQSCTIEGCDKNHLHCNYITKKPVRCHYDDIDENDEPICRKHLETYILKDRIKKNRPLDKYDIKHIKDKRLYCSFDHPYLKSHVQIKMNQLDKNAYERSTKRRHNDGESSSKRHHTDDT
jgi:hypothetical protein